MKTIDDAIHGIRYHSSTWYYVYYIIYETIDRYMYAYYMYVYTCMHSKGCTCTLIIYLCGFYFEDKNKKIL